MNKNLRLEALLICFVLVLHSGAFSNAQDRGVRDLQFELDESLSKSVKRPAAQQPTFDEWKNGKYSPDAYKAKSNDDDETRLKKQRINMALMELAHFKRLADQGVQSLTASVDCQNRLLKAQLDFHTKPKEIVLALEQAFQSAKSTEAIVRGKWDEGVGRTTIQSVGQAAFNKLDIEIQLLRAKKTLQRK